MPIAIVGVLGKEGGQKAGFLVIRHAADRAVSPRAAVVVQGGLRAIPQELAECALTSW